MKFADLGIETAQDMAIAISGYANIVTYIAENKLDIFNSDDVKDAFVETVMDSEHLTDEEIELAYEGFEAVRFIMKPNA